MTAAADAAAPRSARGAMLYRWRYAYAFLGVALLLAAVAAYGVREHRIEAGARDRLAWGLDVQRAALQMENASTLMEVHQRGFLVKGNPQAIRWRDAAYRRGLDQSDVLMALVRDVPGQRRNVERMVAAFKSRYGAMRRVAEAARRDGLAAARAAFILAGDDSVDTVLATIGAVRREQLRIVAEATAEAEDAGRRSSLIALYGTGTALALLLVAAWLLVRQFDRNEQLRRRLEDAHALERARAEDLARSNRELEAFSYTISHDLRAPLRHIDGYARMLQEDAGSQLDAEMRRYLDTISESSRRMGMLIDDLLAYSRLGRKPLDSIDVDMEELTRRTAHDVAGDARATVDIGRLPVVKADPVLLRQAWINLLSNAVKYSAQRGADARIEVRGEAGDGTARFRIRDNGVGFDMRYADKLFGVFQRLHSQDEFEGTGVGLAIVRQVVERHGGRVWAEAVPGEGATFHVELPTGGSP